MNINYICYKLLIFITYIPLIFFLNEGQGGNTTKYKLFLSSQKF
jgi:hypothetical protein